MLHLCGLILVMHAAFVKIPYYKSCKYYIKNSTPYHYYETIYCHKCDEHRHTLIRQISLCQRRWPAISRWRGAPRFRQGGGGRKMGGANCPATHNTQWSLSRVGTWGECEYYSKVAMQTAAPCLGRKIGPISVASSEPFILVPRWFFLSVERRSRPRNQPILRQVNSVVANEHILPVSLRKCLFWLTSSAGSFWIWDELGGVRGPHEWAGYRKEIC